jgi:hypothetical protein
LSNSPAEGERLKTRNLFNATGAKLGTGTEPDGLLTVADAKW